MGSAKTEPILLWVCGIRISVGMVGHGSSTNSVWAVQDWNWLQTGLESVWYLAIMVVSVWCAVRPRWKVLDCPLSVAYYTFQWLHFFRYGIHDVCGPIKQLGWAVLGVQQTVAFSAAQLILIDRFFTNNILAVRKQRWCQWCCIQCVQLCLIASYDMITIHVIGVCRLPW